MDSFVKNTDGPGANHEVPPPGRWGLLVYYVTLVYYGTLAPNKDLKG